VEVFWDAARPIRVARTAIGRLERAGIVKTFTAMAHPELPLRGPLLDWREGNSLPDFERLAWQLKSRWTEPPIRTRVVYATAKAKQGFGSLCGERKVRAKEISHDIGVAQCFFELRRTHPELTDHWVGEDQLRAEGREGDIPDAVVRIREGAEVIIEFGGAYDARKLRAIHANYATHGRYQVW
jgi:hypothetical protein